LYHKDARSLIQFNIMFIELNVMILQIGSQYLSENPIQGIEDKKLSIASASEMSSSQNLPKQMHQLDSTSPSNITSESNQERNSQFSPSGAPLVQRKGNSLAQFQIEYLAVILIIFVFHVRLFYD
jgi:hypothetical protein